VSAAAPEGLTELEDRWLLPFSGLAVTQVVVDFEFGLVLGSEARVSIATSAELRWAAQGVVQDAVELHPERQDVAAGLALFNSSVLSAVAFKTGILRLGFGDGHLLNVAPSPTYEAWTANGPGGLLVVCMPGGSLSVWQPQP
jgi:hypothetical protein